MSDPSGENGPDVETSAAADDAPAGRPEVESNADDGPTRGRAEQPEDAPTDPWEPHLHPERLAMTGEDVLHALDPRHWLPESRRHAADEEDEYPHIRADWPAPFG